MAAPAYSTNLADITTAETVTGWSALGGGQAGLNDETDYYIQGNQCVSKNGFTADIKGIIFNAGATTIASGDAVYFWVKQNNRNLINAQSVGGGQVLIGSGTSAYDQFYVDGNDVDGSALAGWRTYCVDPTSTPSNTTGSPSGTSYFGALWNVGGSGSLKGAPNAIDAIRHGSSLTCTEGDLANGYATFAGAAAFDSDTTRAWGILTPVAGGFQFHGKFVIGVSGGTTCDFRDSNRNIVVLDDPFVAAAFNSFTVSALSSAEWTNITIQHLGTQSPSTLSLSAGTFTGDLCRFVGCGETTLGGSSNSCTNTTWQSSLGIISGGANVSGSSFLTPTSPADGYGLFESGRTISTPTSLTEYDNCTFSQGSNAHHALQFSTDVSADITLTGIEFSSFSSSDNVDGSTLNFLRTTGSHNVNLVGCTVDGGPATTSNIGVKSAGVSITLVIDPVTTRITVQDPDRNPISGCRVLAETADDGGGTGLPFEAATSSLTQSSGTATLVASASHGLATNDYIVVRGANEERYNKVAQITVVNATTLTYAVDAGAGGSAGGTPVFSYCAIGGVVTNGSGVVESSKTWPASQGLKGWARFKPTSAPFYQDGDIIISDASGGSDITVTLQLD